MHFLTLPWKLIFALIPPTGKSPTRYRHSKNANSKGRKYIKFYFYSQSPNITVIITIISLYTFNEFSIWDMRIEFNEDFL